MDRKELDDKLSAIFDAHGAFFAFSKQQFREGANQSLVYVNCGAGLVCPVNQKDSLFKQMDEAIEAFRKSELEALGRKGLIHKELLNYECQIQINPEDAVQALAPYGITEEEVQAEWGSFMQHCIKHNYF